MGARDNDKDLEFACECVSSAGGYSDPWAAVAQNRLLPDGTKERIVNLVARRPRTVAQLAERLGLSKPSVHTHVAEMVASELLRESEAWEKRHPTERYFEPNFPIVTALERAELDEVCRALAARVADLFEEHADEMRNAFERTELAERGWTFEDVTQYLFAKVQRGARVRLEARGTVARRERRGNGLEWTFWAEHRGK
jgi:DNA-binding transcriptional ArsR family regulator